MLFCGRTGSCGGGEDTKSQSSSPVDGGAAAGGAATGRLASPLDWYVPDAGLPFCCIEGVPGLELVDISAAKGSWEGGGGWLDLCWPGVGVAGLERGNALDNEAKAS